MSAPRFATGNVVGYLNGKVMDVRQMATATKLTVSEIEEIYPFTVGGQAKTLCVAAHWLQRRAELTATLCSCPDLAVPRRTEHSSATWLSSQCPR